MYTLSEKFREGGRTASCAIFLISTSMNNSFLPSLTHSSTQLIYSSKADYMTLGVKVTEMNVSLAPKELTVQQGKLSEQTLV